MFRKVVITMRVFRMKVFSSFLLAILLYQLPHSWLSKFVTRKIKFTRIAESLSSFQFLCPKHCTKLSKTLYQVEITGSRVLALPTFTATTVTVTVITTVITTVRSPASSTFDLNRQLHQMILQFVVGQVEGKTGSKQYTKIKPEIYRYKYTRLIDP